ncbi:30S ribosomal protein S6 [Candidatus Aerophobetes bacterium]|nr:30S ribosomal protein S6 [Candidatus Aerophobetes bacterium]
MRLYEIVFVLRPKLDEESLKNVKDEIKGFIEQNEGKVEKFIDLGKKKLTYEVEKEEEGYFIKAFFSVDSSPVNELIRWMRAQDNIIRLVVAKAKLDILSLENTERRKADVSSK